MKILIDMCLSPQWAEFLGAAGFESIHWSSVGHGSASDAEIMQFAATRGYIVFTHDLDFGAVLAKQQLIRPRVVQVRAQDVLPSAIGDLIVRALDASRAQLESGALLTIDPVRKRIRVLPL